MKMKTMISAIICITMFHSKIFSQSVSWKELFIPDSSKLTFTVSNGTSIFANSNSGLYVSTDKGSNWTLISHQFDGISSSIKYTFSNKAIFIIIGDTLLFRTKDAGKTWTQLNPPIYYWTISSILYTGGKLFISFPNSKTFNFYYGAIYSSSDDGDTWKLLNNNIQGANILSSSNLRNDPTGSLYVGCLSFGYQPGGGNPWQYLAGGGISRSTDNGASWSNIYSENNTIYKIETSYVDSSLIIIEGVHDQPASYVYQKTNHGLINYSSDYIPTSTISNSTGNIFVGTTGGIIRLNQNVYGANNWEQVNTGLVDMNIQLLLADSSGYIYAETSTGRLFRTEKSTLTGIKLIDNETQPLSFSLFQNYPNPFNPSTNISFRLSLKSFVSLKIYDELGRQISSLISGELSAGTHSQQWNAGNLASGVYFYRLQAGTFVETKKLILQK